MKYFIYVLIGGSLVSGVTYFASHARGLTAAFLANLPVLTLITFLTIYYQSGQPAVMDYAKGLLVMLFPWFAYITSLMLLSPRIGVIPSLGVGLTAYLVLAFAIIILKKM